MDSAQPFIPQLVTNLQQLKPEKKRRVTQACIECQKSHVSCEARRPCKRCDERGKVCIDGEAKRRGKKKRESEGIREAQVFKTADGREQRLQPHPYSETLFGQSLFLTTEASLQPDASPPMHGTEMDMEIAELLANQEEMIPQEVLKFTELMFSPFEMVYAMSHEPITSDSMEHFKRVKKVMSNRLPEGEYHYFSAILKESRECLLRINERVTPETGEQMKVEFQSHLMKFKACFDELAMPAIAWERANIVHYVNNAFRKLTGFTDATPTPLEECTLLHLLSTHGLKRYISQLSHFLTYEVASDPKEIKSWLFPCGFRLAGTENKFVEGYLNITVKRGPFGLPLIFLASFTPIVA